MIRKKMLSPLFIAAALVAFPAWSADSDIVVAAPADSVAQNQKPDRVADVSPPARYEQSNDRPAPRYERHLPNPSNPLGAYSKVNPLEPSPG
jgi:hypothetical protein